MMTVSLNCVRCLRYAGRAENWEERAGCGSRELTLVRSYRVTSNWCWRCCLTRCVHSNAVAHVAQCLFNGVNKNFRIPSSLAD